VEHAVKVMGRPISGRGRYYDELAPKMDLEGNTYADHIPTFSFGCQMVELEVDMETGHIKVLKVVAVHDTGKTINPVTSSGQIEGAVVQGLGYALTEDVILKNGRMLNDNFLDYKLYRASDCPIIETGFVESNEPLGPFGAKGIGEAGLVPTAAAVINAVYDATGIMFRSLPVTPQKVLRALNII